MTDSEGRLVRTESAAETEALGEQLAPGLDAGDVLLIEGDVGAGKTTLVRGICRGLGVTDRVSSPTFTIGQVYRGGPVRVAHLDLYRIADTGSEDPSLLDDYLGPDTVALIEWPGAGGSALRSRAGTVVAMSHAGEDAREILVTAL